MSAHFLTKDNFIVFTHYFYNICPRKHLHLTVKKIISLCVELSYLYNLILNIQSLNTLPFLLFLYLHVYYILMLQKKMDLLVGWLMMTISTQTTE